MSDLVDRVTDVAKRYRHGHERPMGTYSVLNVVYVGLVGGIGLLARRRPIPRCA